MDDELFPGEEGGEPSRDTTVGGAAVDPSGDADNTPSSLVDFADRPPAGPGELGGLDPGSTTGFPPGRELFYDSRTNSIVDAKGNIIIQDTSRLAKAIDDMQASRPGPERDSAFQRLAKELEPVNRFTGTPIGRTLATLGLGALATGVSQLLAPGKSNFRPPPTSLSSVDNPAAQRLATDIRGANLKRLKGLSDPAAATGDPTTDTLTNRLGEALAGRISNPILAKSNEDEKNQFLNRMQRLYGSNWERDTNAQKERSTLSDSQSIRTYLDNMNTIARFEPAQRARIADTTNQAARLSGLGNVDADLAHRSDLASQLAYNDFVEERNRQNERAKSIGGIFSLAAGAASGGGSRRPWDQPIY